MADELRKLAADLSDVPGGIPPLARKALQVTAFNIRRDWRSAAARTGLSGYAASISYETKSTATEVSAEIGPVVGKGQGSMGFVEDAPGGVKSRPQHAGRDALEANEQDFYDGLAKAAADALLEGLGL